MSDLIHRVQAKVDRRALAHNFGIAKIHAQGSRMLAAIKANAYGHGLVPVAEALDAADVFGVTDIDEAEQLRAGGTVKDILILQGLIDRSDIARIAHHGFQVVIHTLEHLQWLEEELDRLTLRSPLTFWVKLDSGMGRLGLAPRDYVEACRALVAKPWTAGIVMMTHLANASLPASELNARQLACFKAIHRQLADVYPAVTIHEQEMDLRARFREHGTDSASRLTLTRMVEQRRTLPTSIAASAGMLALDCRSSWARPGIMLYGSSPFAWADATRRRETWNLQPVMTLQARLLCVTENQAGANIGYNSQFICPAPMRIGIVSCGYADGYPSNTPNGSPVAVRGQRSSTVGRVSMDMLAIDLSHIPEAQPGDAVELWGATVSVDEVAAHTGILSYNLLCSVAARVPRIHT